MTLGWTGNQMTIQHPYTTSTAADTLDLARSTVARQCAAGRFPGAVKHGRDWTIPADAVEVYRAALLGNPGPQTMTATADYVTDHAGYNMRLVLTYRGREVWSRPVDQTSPADRANAPREAKRWAAAHGFARVKWG